MNSETAHHAARHRAESRFRWYGRLALSAATACLVLLLVSIAWRGVPGFVQTEIALDVTLNPALLELAPGEEVRYLTPARFNPMLRAALAEKFPALATDAAARRSLFRLLGDGAGYTVKKTLAANEKLLGSRQHFVLPASRLVASYYASGDLSGLDAPQRDALRTLVQEGAVHRGMKTAFFTQADSRSPENAGFLGAMAGSFLVMVVCFLAAFPVGVASAVYLEEFARKGRFATLVEINVNNLAAVPSIVYGLLGLSVYINMMHLPRSAALVGGLTLALMALPVIIIATRTALKSIPPSIKQGALALGASPLQVMWHHTLPLSMPGIMTGTILAMARSIGETAPLLMIGMVAFVADVPGGFIDPATVMPVQIYLWASSPELAFAEKTAAAILVLLVLLLAMNALAIYLRKKFEVRW